jgi:hypothetical protein
MPTIRQMVHSQPPGPFVDLSLPERVQTTVDREWLTAG